MRVCLLMLLTVVAAVNCGPIDDGFDFGRQDHDDDRRHFPEFGFGQGGFNSDEDDESFDSLLNQLMALFQLWNSSVANQYPPNYHNSSSTTDVINGTKVVINKTIDKETDKDNNTFFVEIDKIDVEPQNSTDEGSSSAAPAPAVGGGETTTEVGKEAAATAENGSGSTSEAPGSGGESSTGVGTEQTAQHNELTP